MSRPKRDPRDEFNTTELAIAGNMTKRQFQLLSETPGLFPADRGVSALKMFAFAGAVVATGTAPVAAARIAVALAVEFEGGDPPSGLKEAAEKWAVPELSTLPAEPNDYWYHRAILLAECREMRQTLTRSEGKLTIMNGAELKGDDYWEHVSRLREQKQYYAGMVPAMPSDVRIEICDRRHVFMWPTSRLKKFADDREWEREFRAKHPWKPGHEPPPKPGFVGWIEGWDRASEARFKHVSEVIQLDPNEEPHKSRIAFLKQEYGEEKYREWYGNDDHDQMWRGNAARMQGIAEQEVYPNATGKLTVNVSLAIRRAFDRIAEHRWKRLQKPETAQKAEAETE